MKTKITLILALFLLSGCYTRRRFAEKAIEISQPILEDYREYLNKDTELPEDSRRIRARTVDKFESFLKEGTR